MAVRHNGKICFALPPLMEKCDRRGDGDDDDADGDGDDVGDGGGPVH